MKYTLTLAAILVSFISFAQPPYLRPQQKPTQIALFSTRDIEPVIYYLPSKDRRHIPTPDTAVYLLIGGHDNYSDDTLGAAITDWFVKSKKGKILDGGIDTMFYADYRAWSGENISMARLICYKHNFILK